MSVGPKTRGILVTSGKGGVGKSLFSVGLAAALSRTGPTGLLDIDTRSPNIPCLLNNPGPCDIIREGPFSGCPIPKKFTFGPGKEIRVFSSAYIFSEGKSVTMPGEQIRSFVRDFILDVDWGNISYLVLDVDPGPGDSIAAAKDTLIDLNAFVVTAPDVSSIADGDRMLDALESEGIHRLGVVGNMVGAECPSCHARIPYGDVRPIEALAKRHETPFLGYLPWDPIYRQDPVGSVQGATLFHDMARAVAFR